MRQNSGAKSSGESPLWEESTAASRAPFISGDSRRDYDDDSEHSPYHQEIWQPSVSPANHTSIFVSGSSWRHRFREGSLKVSIFSLASSTLGAGIVSLPYAFRCLGFLMGCVVLIGLAVASCTATRLLTHALLDKRKASYEELAEDCGGRSLLFFTQLVQIAFNMGAAAGYIVCLHDVLAVVVPVLLGTTSHALPSALAILLTLGVLLPLSSLERMGSLRWASLVSLASLEALVIITVAVLIRRGVSPSIVSFHRSYPHSIRAAFQGASLVVFSLSCQSNAPMVLAEMERPALRRMNKVAERTAILSAGTYMVMGLSGFLLFGKDVAENVLLNYKDDVRSSTLILFAFIGILIGVFFSFPMCIFPCRVTVEASPLFRNSRVADFIPAALVGIALLCAFVVPSVATVFALTGSVAGASIGFILPGIFALHSGSLSQRDKVQASACIGLGAIVSVVGTLLTVWHSHYFL